jgi:hypothetical protein
VTTTAVPVQLNIAGGVPSYIAVLVNDTNVIWQPFTTTNLSVSTPTNGAYVVSAGLRGPTPTASETWQTVRLFRETRPLTLVLTNLPALSGSRPFIDPAGYATRALQTLTWTVVDANGITNTGSGTVVAQEWSLLDPFHTTNWFQCADLALALGTNFISIQAVDLAGAVAATNFAYVFNTSGDTTPPALTLVWPQNGAQVSGDTLTVQVGTDDDTATLVLQYTDTDGLTHAISGLVERSGSIWVQNVPLAAGANNFLLTATDAAGNVNMTSFSLVKSGVSLTVTPLTQEQMKYAFAQVVGWVGNPNCTVSVSGIPVRPDASGYWAVDNVPMPPGGVVSLQATAQMDGGGTVQTSLKQERDPIVFTQTFGYSLDYGFPFMADEEHGVYATAAIHTEAHWTRGRGGILSQTEAYQYPAPEGQWTYQTVTTWPPDNGYWPSLSGQRVHQTYHNGQLVSTDSAGVLAPSVEWVERSVAAGRLWAGKYAVPYAESSNREERMLTGVGTGRHSQALFDITAPLTIEGAPSSNWEGWPKDLPEQQDFIPFLLPAGPVPSGQITVGSLGKLGSDGHLYTVQSSGGEFVVTLDAPLPSYTGALPAATKHRLVSHTLHQALTNQDPERARLGVGEEVAIYFDPELEMTFPETPWWLAFDGSISPSVGTAGVYTAPSNAVAATTVRVFVRDLHLDKYFTVEEPTLHGNSRIIATNHLPIGDVGASMDVKVWLQPTDVSFYRVLTCELPALVTNITGYFTNNARYIPSPQVGQAQLDDSNSMEDEIKSDLDGFSSYSLPYYQGSWDYVITNLWTIPGSGITNYLGTATSTSTLLNSEGDFRVSKFGVHITRSVNDVSY